MKTIRTIIVLAIFSILLACSTPLDVSEYILPYPITEITEATAFYDGGSTVIHFVLEDGSKWGLLMNLSLDEKNNPDVYRSLSISQNNYTAQSNIQIEEMDIKIGSQAEYEILSLLYEYRKKHYRKIDKKFLPYIDGLLEEKKYRPTRALSLS